MKRIYLKKQINLIIINFVILHIFYSKNFESKNILLKESQTKIINPFINIISQKDIKEIKYNNNSFNIIIEELTNIMMRKCK